MKIVVAQRHGRRGAGLGNEMLPWAKGWIASQVLHAHLIGPSWGINKRRYYRNFGTTRFDVLLEEFMLRFPHHAFTEQEYRATGEVDFGAAIVRWARSRGLADNDSYIVSVSGMWGGYPSIRNARAFLISKLLNSKDALRNALEVTSKLDREKLFVAVHMRSPQSGHSKLPPSETARGKFNILVPGEWYLWVCEALRNHFGDRIEFRFFTDRGGPEFEEAVRRFNPGQLVQRGLTECSDLWLMTEADLRVCSISSYSLAACFLSGGPYAWYEPQLTLSQDLYSLWGDTESEKADGSLSSRSAAFVSSLMKGNSKSTPAVNFPGTAMDVGDPLPDSLVTMLDHRLSYRDSRTNLIEYGCIPKRGHFKADSDCP
jgi:hypothetical protein